MSFEMVRAEKLFLKKYFNFILFHHWNLENIDDISRSLLKYSFIIA